MKLEWKTCFRASASVLLVFLFVRHWPGIADLLSALLSAAAPLFLGCVIAYLINILMSFYEKHYFPRSGRVFVIKSRRPVCMLAAMLTMIAVIVLVVCLIVPQLMSCVKLLLAEVPDALKSLVMWIDERNLLPDNMTDTLASVNWQSKIGQIIDILLSGLGSVTDIVVRAVSSVISGVVTAFMAIIFSVYLLLGKDTIGRQCKRLMSRYLRKNWYDTVMHILTVIHDCFRRYIVGQCTEAVILGVLCTVGMWLLRLPYAAMIGALIAFTALIPVAGAYIGGAVGAFMIFTVSPVKAVIFLVFLVVLQQLEGNLIYPRVVGSSMGLPAIWVLAAVTVGGGIMGVLGMLIGVPLAATIYRLLREDLNRRPRPVCKV